MLVQNGADVNTTFPRGGTALEAAAIHGHVKVVEMLVHNGADVNATDHRGSTQAGF
jgi:ankyrin repeat protein